jgi:hypothetical protein
MVVSGIALSVSLAACGSPTESVGSENATPPDVTGVAPPQPGTATSSVEVEMSQASWPGTTLRTPVSLPPITISFGNGVVMVPVGKPFESGLEGFPTLGQVFIPENGDPGQVVSASASERGSDLLKAVEDLTPIEDSRREMYSGKGPDGYITILILELVPDVLITLNMSGFDESTARSIAESVKIAVEADS